MIKKFLIDESWIVYGKGELIYKDVIDDFAKTTFIGIITYNISNCLDNRLLKELKDACQNGTDAVIITNIPKRFKTYYGEQYAVSAKKMIDSYMQQLNPQHFAMRLNPYFSFENHAKIIVTDNIVYWGSGNFSDESSGNFECGTISKNKNLIQYVKDEVFPNMKQESVPYYRYNFAEGIANLEILIMVCRNAKEELFGAAFKVWSDYETHFEERLIYRTNDSGINGEFLQKFINKFSRFDEALNVIKSIINDYIDFDELPEPVEKLEKILDEYENEYSNFYEDIMTLIEDISAVANYDVSREACKIIENEYSSESYDENLDLCLDEAMNKASTEYEELIRSAEPTIMELLESLDVMINYFETVKANLYKLLTVSPQIDNAGKQ